MTGPEHQSKPLEPLRPSHIFFGQIGLSAVVLAMPVYDALAASPHFFTANRLSGSDIYWLIAVVSVGIPVAPAVLSLVVRRWTLAPHLTMIFLYAGLYLFLLMNALASLPAATMFIAGIAAAACLTWLYTKHRMAPLAAAILAPGALLFPWRFASDPDIAAAISPPPMVSPDYGIHFASDQPDLPPIVFVVFDELPLLDLLDAEGNIHAGNFPNFAAFASQSTWYENATTVAAETKVAVPAILDGEWPGDHEVATYANHRNNLFALLRNHYTLNVYEATTHLTPPDITRAAVARRPPPQSVRVRRMLEDVVIVYLSLVLPERYSARLPGVGEQWGGFLGDATVGPTDSDAEHPEDTSKIDRRAESFRALVDSLESQPAKTLHYVHTLLPHRPAMYLPSGRRYAESPLHGFRRDGDTDVLLSDQTLALRLHQAHRVQMGFTDTLLGELLDELRRIDLYDKSLVIVCADHGVNYQHGQPIRHPAPENWANVAFVPLMIKYPHQQTAVRDDRLVQLIDILPTIMDVLGATADRDYPGRSLTGPESAPHEVVKMYHHSLDEPLVLSRNAALMLKEDAHERILNRFQPRDGRSNLFWYGDVAPLAGQSTAKVSGRLSDCSISEIEYENHRIRGVLDPGEYDARDLRVVVAANDSVVAAGPPYPESDRWYFDFLIPETDFDPNAQIEVFLVEKSSLPQAQRDVEVLTSSK